MKKYYHKRTGVVVVERPSGNYLAIGDYLEKPNSYPHIDKIFIEHSNDWAKIPEAKEEYSGWITEVGLQYLQKGLGAYIDSVKGNDLYAYEVKVVIERAVE